MLSSLSALNVFLSWHQHNSFIYFHFHMLSIVHSFSLFLFSIFTIYLLLFYSFRLWIGDACLRYVMHYITIESHNTLLIFSYRMCCAVVPKRLISYDAQNMSEKSDDVQTKAKKKRAISRVFSLTCRIS